MRDRLALVNLLMMSAEAEQEHKETVFRLLSACRVFCREIKRHSNADCMEVLVELLRNIDCQSYFEVVVVLWIVRWLIRSEAAV